MREKLIVYSFHMHFIRNYCLIPLGILQDYMFDLLDRNGNIQNCDFRKLLLYEKFIANKKAFLKLGTDEQLKICEIGN